MTGRHRPLLTARFVDCRASLVVVIRTRWISDLVWWWKCRTRARAVGAGLSKQPGEE